MRGIHRLQPIVAMDEAHLLSREMLEETAQVYLYE